MATDDFFRARLDGMVDPRHPLAVLGRRMPWSQIEASLAPLFARKARMGKSREDADMFGPRWWWPPAASAVRAARACRSG